MSYICGDMANYQVKTLSEFESLLHKHGLKATKQRLSVHAAMIAGDA